MSSPSRSTVIVRDPVHGDIELTREEMRVVDTAQVQRLRGIRQLGTAYLVFPGAVHTRFEHSLGTVHTAERLITAINRNAERDPVGCLGVPDAARRVLRMAALLHDVTHVPFGHNIEDQTGLLPRHDTPQRFATLLGDTELGAELQRAGLRDDVLAVLAGGAEVPPYWRQLLSDTIDADLMDYLRRDAYYTGLELRYDQRVVGYFRVERTSQQMFVDCAKEGMLREDIVSELVRVLDMRFAFSERVYYHHAKIAAGALVARMAELALRSGGLAPADLQAASDQSLLDRLAAIGAASGDRRLSRMAACFARRELPKRVLVLPMAENRGQQELLLQRYFTPGQPQARYDYEAECERAARAALGRDVDILMYCPARRMQLKEARTLVRFPDRDALQPLSDRVDALPRLRDLEQRYPALWKLYVFTSERDRDARRRLQEICAAALPAGCTNVLAL